MSLLAGVKVAVDVQHLYKAPRWVDLNEDRKLVFGADRGTRFVTGEGLVVWEGEAASLYAAALTTQLRSWGAEVLTNDPKTETLIGAYPTRNRYAALWGADVYLACHINGGGGGYALSEHLDGSPGYGVGTAITSALYFAVKEITDVRTITLRSSDRGAICVRNCPPRVAATIVEPFFGDNPAHQGLLAAPGLARVGAAIAVGVANWWHRAHA